MTKKLKDASVVTGTYEKDGQTKKRYQTIGALMESNDGGMFLLIDPFFNFAAVQREPGKDRVLVGLFDVKDKPVHGDDQYKAATGQSPAATAKALDDEIPF